MHINYLFNRGNIKRYLRGENGARGKETNLIYSIALHNIIVNNVKPFVIRHLAKNFLKRSFYKIQLYKIAYNI